MNISCNHPNRQAFNWLIYDIGDQWLLKHASLYKGVLYDLGCGEMPYRDWLLQYADTYTGVDWSDTLHKLNADILADLNLPLPIENEIADTVVSFSVMEHLAEPQNMLNEAYRIIKPGGAMILQVPFMWWVHEAPFDYYRYTRHGLKYMFEKAGFTDVSVYPQTGFWVMWTLKFNYQTTRLIRGPWLGRNVMRLLLRAVWAIDQRVAPWLDQHWRCEEETAGYFVVAHKP
ncbi:class I SAM-dependent methyltransferase [Methylomonas rapida]|uniref:Methyltransferase domain-containing protein n=1 Tax=Methylomonas rapida TaxID=2963939 RepID=A0ABY7GIH5_9GAMM|nr:class I SAM-dependent methyltransferase [Methylomonas rapida]WAR44081.1 methyltransferase domain-containing protein [Methylomonas rapida]